MIEKERDKEVHHVTFGMSLVLSGLSFLSFYKTGIWNKCPL